MKAIIEIPRGDDRRRHIRYDHTGFIDLGPIKEKIPINQGIMPVHYGYLLGTYNESEGDEVDVLVISQNKFSVGQTVEVTPIALILRDDGDDKIVAVDSTVVAVEKWADLSTGDQKMLLDFFGYRHRILSVENATEANQYIVRNTKSSRLK